MVKKSFLVKWREELFAGILGGFLLALSFPPYPTRLLALFALVPLFRYFLVVFPSYKGRKERLKRGFLAGWFYGITLFLVLLFWITNLIPASSVNLRWVLTPGLILLVMYLGLYVGLFGLATAALYDRVGRKALIAAPALWGITEYLRCSGELSFSWGVISGSLLKYPLASQGLSITGPFGYAMLIVTVNLLIASALFIRGRAGRLQAVLLLAVLVSAAVIVGHFRIKSIDRAIASADGHAVVAIVQPNLDLGKKWKPVYRDTIFAEIEELTEKAAALGAELVIFPETAAPVSMSHNRKYRAWMKSIAKDAGVDVYIGYVRHEREGERWRSFNSSGIFDRRGLLTQQYDKINLLQFGERIPFSGWFSFLERMDFGQANFGRGEEQTIFDSPVGRFGSLICFESTFSGYSRDYIGLGADFLVNITNDGWFGGARGPLQHSESAIQRAIENGVTVLRAANTGVSMLIDPAGRVVESIGLDREGILLVPVYKVSSKTPYSRYGQLVFIGMALLNVALAGGAALSSTRRKQHPPGESI
jgi:apolipoprotein N-acyltransferase